MKKIAIITGASSGIGREFVRQIAAREKLDEIWVIARRRERLEELRAAILMPLRILPMDLTDSKTILTMKSLLTEEKPDVRILVNASGFGKYGTYKDLTYHEVNQMIDLNIRSVVNLTYTVLPFMRKKSRILIMGSASAFQPLPEFNLYASTKAFIVHFSRALNVELESRDITVTAVCPGYVRTEFIKVAQDTKNPTTCTNFKPLYEAEDVVAKALRDSLAGKDLSVLGLDTKLKRLSGKLLPSALVMKVWMKIK